MARDGRGLNRPAREYIVEVVGADGILHHLGPFQQRVDAERWIRLNDKARRGPKRARDETARPNLSVV
jgi:hypothetical protein